MAKPNPMAAALVPLVLDAAVPVAVYVACHYVLGWALVPSLVAGSVVPAGRSVFAAVRQARVNALAVLVLTVNVAGIALSFVSGDARILFAKDSGISSIVAIGILVSVLRGRPLMSEGLAPFLTRGDDARTAAWHRLSSGSDRFRRLERRFTLIWGVALLGDCVARLVCAFTVPVAVLSWLSGVLIVGAILAAMVVGGGAASNPMQQLIDAEVDGAQDGGAPDVSKR